MGLLTSDASNSCSSIGKRLNQHHALLTVTVCSLAISGFLLLPCEQITDRTYFSENALLPGLVQRRFADHVHIERSLQQLQQGSRASGDRLPVELLTRMFVEQGLHVYEHNFTFTYPFGRRTSSVGRNLYALIRAPRSAGTEAIVLSSPYRSETSPHGSSLPGIALLLSLGRYFARQTYWAKDIIILVYEHELIGCQAWLQAYHSNPTLGRMSMTDESHDQVIRAGDLAFRSGQIQAAINLEVHSSLSSRLDIKIEGFNGQLPNLDLFNVAVELATRESCTPTFHGRSHSFSGSNRDLWLEYAQTLLSMSLRQASSLPTGAHAIFQKYAIQAITLQTLDQENSSAYLTITLSQLAGVLEGVVRSLNNLLERFNRSYWFYLLASTRRYISIGIYMIPFALLSSAILLRVIRLVYCWSDLSSTSKLANRQNDLWPAISFAFVCHLLGLSLACVPFLIQNWINSNQTSASSIESTSSINPWPIEDVLFYTIMCFCISCMHNPLYDLNPLRRRQRRSSLIVLLLNVLLVFGALSLLNFSLAVLLTAIHLPFLLLMPADSPVTLSRKLVDATIKLASILIHPISLTFICALISSWQHDSDDSIRGHLQRSVYGLKRIILFTVEDWYIHDNWMFALVTTGLFPIWLQFWNLV